MHINVAIYITTGGAWQRIGQQWTHSEISSRGWFQGRVHRHWTATGQEDQDL